MRLAAVIDENIPWEGEVPLGILVEIMVCNRLLNPKAQYKIGEWAKSAGVCDYYDVTAEQLNDDRYIQHRVVRRLRAANAGNARESARAGHPVSIR